MKFSYEMIETYCNELHDLAKNMRSTLENAGDLGTKISNNWNGPASEYYIGKMTNLANQFEDIFKEIENSILYLASCSEGYDAIEENTKREICQNLKIMEPSLSTSNIFS